MEKDVLERGGMDIVIANNMNPHRSKFKVQSSIYGIKSVARIFATRSENYVVISPTTQ